MTFRKLVPFLFQTLLVGGLVTVIASVLFQSERYSEAFFTNDWFDVSGLTIAMFGLGLVFSLISQMGFFAYLTIHRFGLGVFRGPKLWNSVQWVIIAFAIFDLIYLKGISDTGLDKTTLVYIGLGVGLFLMGWFVAKRKAAETNRQAFVPALFY
ncbi:MAG: KinB-signaling pathway activation protein, partial [Bacilli bacterium]